MTLSPKQAKSLNMNRTIDLRYSNAVNYIDKKQTASFKQKIINFLTITCFWFGVLTLSFIMYLAFAGIFKADANDMQTEIRKARIEACTQAYYEYQDWVDSRYKHTNQNIIIRCATFSSLVFAKESGYGKSNRCLNHLNCFGLKNLSVDLKPLEGINVEVVDNRFLKFENYDDGNLLFARLYMRWNFNKDIETFVKGYSETDIETYISFISSKYWETYKSLKQLQ